MVVVNWTSLRMISHFLCCSWLESNISSSREKKSTSIQALTKSVRRVICNQMREHHGPLDSPPLALHAALPFPFFVFTLS